MNPCREDGKRQESSQIVGQLRDVDDEVDPRRMESDKGFDEYHDRCRDVQCKHQKGVDLNQLNETWNYRS